MGDAPLTPDDYDSADEAIRANPRLSKVGRDELARLHAKWGHSRFELRCRLRPPGCEIEQWEIDYYDRKITYEELTRRFKAEEDREIDESVLDRLYDHLFERVSCYSAFLQAVCRCKLADDRRDRDPENDEHVVRRLLARTKGKSPLLTSQLEKLGQLAEEARLEWKLGSISIKDYTATESLVFVERVLDSVRRAWAICCETSDGRGWNRQSASQLFFSQFLSSFPLPRELLGVIEPELAVARQLLRRRRAQHTAVSANTSEQAIHPDRARGPEANQAQVMTDDNKENQPHDHLIAIEAGMAPPDQDDQTVVAVQKLWVTDPVKCFQNLRDRCTDGLSLVIEGYERSAVAQNDVSLTEVCADLLDPLVQILAEANAYWFHTPIAEYMHRNEGVVYLDPSESGRDRVNGCCYHELALKIIAGLQSNIDSHQSARSYARRMRFLSAVGHHVGQRLSNVMSSIWAEWQMAIRRFRRQNRQPNDLPCLNDGKRRSGSSTASENPPPPALQVTHWADLAIGIDEHRRYWAIAPPPASGQIFPMRQAVLLSLIGVRWRTLLRLAARTPDGRTVPLADLLRELGTVAGPSTLASDSRAHPGEIKNGQIEGARLSRKRSGILRKLQLTLGDLRRKLRNVVRGPQEEEPTILVQDKNTIDLGFVVRYLVFDENRRYRFGTSS